MWRDVRYLKPHLFSLQGDEGAENLMQVPLPNRICHALPDKDVPKMPFYSLSSEIVCPLVVQSHENLFFLIKKTRAL